MNVKGLIIVILGLAFICPATSIAVGVGDPSPDFSTRTIDGTGVNSQNIKGNKPLFLIFWATWCPVCKEEIPKLKEIYSTFGPKGMEFLAINVGINDSERKIKRYMKKYQTSYPVAFDQGSKITKRFGVMGTPTIIIVDKGGTVRYRSAEIPDDLEEHFDMLMK